MAQGCSAFLVCLAFAGYSANGFADDFESALDTDAFPRARVTADSGNRVVTPELVRAGRSSPGAVAISPEDRLRFISDVNAQLGFGRSNIDRPTNNRNAITGSNVRVGPDRETNGPGGLARTTSGERIVRDREAMTSGTNRQFVPGGPLPKEETFQPGGAGINNSSSAQPTENGGGDINIYVQAPQAAQPPPAMDLDQWRQYQKAVRAAETASDNGQDPHSAAVEPEPPSKDMSDLIKAFAQMKPEKDKEPSGLEKWVEQKNEKTEEIVAEAEAALNDPKMPQEERAKILEKLVQASEGGETDPALEAAKQMAANVLGKRLPGGPTVERFNDRALDPSGRYIGEFVGIRSADPFRSALERERAFFSPDAGTYAPAGAGRAPSRAVASYDEPKEEPKKKSDGPPKTKATGLPPFLGMPPKPEPPGTALKKISPSLIRELAATMQSQQRRASRWLSSVKRGENRVKAGLAAVTSKVSPKLAGLLFDPTEANEEDLPWITLVFLTFGLASVAALLRWKRLDGHP